MKTAAFFDMDGTLLNRESQFGFLLWCWRRGFTPPLRTALVLSGYAGYLLGLSADATRLRESGFALLQGVPMVRLEKAGAEFFAAQLAKSFRRQAGALVAAHRQRGHVTVLVTSAGEPVANPVAARLGLEALIATRLIVRDGVCTGTRELPEPYGAGKRTLAERFCAANGIRPEHCFAYADHHTDEALLEWVGHPVAVNPTKKLRRIAEAKGWPIVDLDAPGLPDGLFEEREKPC